MKRYLTQTLGTLSFIFMVTESVQAQVPVADFTSCNRIIEQYSVAELTDLSTNSPNAWKWEVLDASGGDAIADGSVYANNSNRNETTKNPILEFDVPGCYTIRLTATNATGNSTPVSKTCFIEVMPGYHAYLGFGTYLSSYNFGFIYDSGGPNLNYSNNQGVGSKSYLKMTPQNGLNITLRFNQIRLADDTLSVYDDDTINAVKLIARLTSASNGTHPTFVSSSGKMFVIFKSNSSLTDSGYQAVFYTDQDPTKPLKSNITTVKNVLGKPSVFINKQTSILARNYTREWYVNDTLQSGYTDQDTLRHTFYNTNTYKITLKVKSCNIIDSTIVYGNDIRDTSCKAKFKIDTLSQCKINFISLSDPGYKMTWEVNGQVFPKGHAFNYSFDDFDTFKVHLYVHDTVNVCTDTMYKSFEGRKKLQFDSYVYKQHLYLTSLYTFKQKDSFVTHELLFGDGGKAQSKLGIFDYTYSNAGNYSVKLKTYEKFIIQGQERLCAFMPKDSIKTISINNNSDTCRSFFVMKKFDEIKDSVFVINHSAGENLKYEWDFGDGFKSNLKYPEHTYNLTQKVYVCLKITDTVTHISSTRCDSLFVKPGLYVQVIGNIDFETGIDYPELSAHTTVYPNPFTGRITINLPPVNTDISYAVYDHTGVLIASGNIPSQEDHYNLDLSESVQGVYFIVLSLNNNRVIRKIIKID